MIKIALQHWILEQCINVLFEKIQLNFTKLFTFKVGDKFRRIEAKPLYLPVDVQEFNVCKITHVKPSYIIVKHETAREIKKLNDRTTHIRLFVTEDNNTYFSSMIFLSEIINILK